MPRAFQMTMCAGRFAGDPFAFAGGQSDLAVDRQRQLQGDARAAEREAGEVTGHRAAGGIGGGAARRFAAEGASVVLTDVSVPAVTAVADEIRARPETRVRALEALRKAFGAPPRNLKEPLSEPVFESDL